MGSATAASPGCITGVEFPHNVVSIVGESGKARRAGAAAPTRAPAPILRRRLLRDIDITILRSAPAFAGETFTIGKAVSEILRARRPPETPRRLPRCVFYCVGLLNS